MNAVRCGLPTQLHTQGQTKALEVNLDILLTHYFLLPVSAELSHREEETGRRENMRGNISAYPLYTIALFTSSALTSSLRYMKLLKGYGGSSSSLFVY
jgi:hypothetical protein